MQILINIEEEIFDRVKGKELLMAHEVTDCIRAIAKGTSLSKGHGRLIDADVIEYYPDCTDCCGSETGECKTCTAEKEIAYKSDIDELETIIEAG